MSTSRSYTNDILKASPHSQCRRKDTTEESAEGSETARTRYCALRPQHCVAP